MRVHLVEPGPFRTPISAASPIAAAKDPDGVYAEHWKVIEDWLSWHAESSADPAQCIAAIVGAVTRDDAPFRIPVGDGISDVVRKHAGRRHEAGRRRRRLARHPLTGGRSRCSRK